MSLGYPLYVNGREVRGPVTISHRPGAVLGAWIPPDVPPDETEAEKAQRLKERDNRLRNSAILITLLVTGIAGVLLWGVTADERRRRPPR